MPAIQRGEVVRLKSRDPQTGKPLWAYRFREGGKYKQTGGFRTKGEATAALGKALDRKRGREEPLTVEALADKYLERYRKEQNSKTTLAARLKYVTREF